MMDKPTKKELIAKYSNANRRLILLDYDGTLVNHTMIPETTRVTGQLHDVLIKLIAELRTDVFIITGRPYNEIDEILVCIPINIIAEHGAMIKINGKWNNQINKNDSWKETVVPVLTSITSECPGSFIEEKIFSLAWHYRNAKPESGRTYSKKIIGNLENSVQPGELKILYGNKVVEIMPREIGKGNAVKKLFEQNNYDFILSIGDDATDEEVFEFFSNNTNAFTVKVGKRKTFARYNLNRVNDVVSLLKNLSQ